MTHFPDFLDPQQHTWLHDPGLTKLFKALALSGGEARIVGGAVRDALLGRSIGDIDLAVNLPPDVTANLLTTAGIKVVPTGLEHGTLTAVIDHRGYEITSLRRDIETDGRHAKVTYTEDWQEDASRRDFTFNALYVDSTGQIYDYFGGRDDLAEGKVRFIGQPTERIREDVLRILRFFRFYAWFGKDGPDPDGLESCRQLAALLPQLSAERVWHEINKLLTALLPLASWCAMQQNFILAQLLPEADNIQLLEKSIEIEIKYGVPPSSLRRLAALIPPHLKAVQDLTRRLKLSNREAQSLQHCVLDPAKLKNDLTPDSLPASLYKFGRENTQNAAIIVFSEGFDTKSDLKTIFKLCSEWKSPIFPLRGDDLLGIGLKPGPDIGIMLRRIEDWWIAHKFQPDHIACLSQARLLTSSSTKE